MATLTITLGSQDLIDLVALYSREYSATGADGEANPESRAQYARRKLKDNFSMQIKMYRIGEATKSPSTIDSVITIS